MAWGMVYIATHIPTRRAYVGQTKKEFKKRLQEHIFPSCHTHFSKALRYYGIDQFDFKFIPCPTERLDVLEQDWINILSSRHPNGFNFTDGGKGTVGHHGTEEGLHRWKSAMIGRTLSAETRRKMSIAHKGRKIPDEVRKKIAATLMGHAVSEKSRLKNSRAHTDKTTEEMRADQKERMRRYYQDHRDAIREYQRRWREENREKLLEDKHQWYLAYKSKKETENNDVAFSG